MSEQAQCSEQHVCWLCGQWGATVFHGYITHGVQGWRHEDCVLQPPATPVDDVQKRIEAIRKKCEKLTGRDLVLETADTVTYAHHRMFNPKESRTIHGAIIKATAESVEPLLTRIEELEKEVAEFRAVVNDPRAVHANILRGTIALTRQQALHIAGATDYDALQAKLAEAEKDKERMTEYAMHSATCPMPANTCDCGLAELLSASKPV